MSLENKIDELKIALQDTTTALIKAMETVKTEKEPVITAKKLAVEVHDSISPPEEFTAKVLKDLSQELMAKGIERKSIKAEIEKIKKGGSISCLDSKQLAKLHAVLINLK